MKKNSFIMFLVSIFVFLFLGFNGAIAMKKEVLDIKLDENDSLEYFDFREDKNLIPLGINSFCLKGVKKFLSYKNLDAYFKGNPLTKHEFYKKIFEQYLNYVLEQYYYSQNAIGYECFGNGEKAACDFLKNFKDELVENCFIQNSFKIKIKNVNSKMFELLENTIKVFNYFEVEEKWNFLKYDKGAMVLYMYFMFVREFIVYVNNNQSNIETIYKKYNK